MTTPKVAMLGGSFDPVHLGHLFLLHCAVSMTDYNRFLIIPAKVSNFKQDSRPQASDRNRLDMLYLALEDYRDLYPQDVGVRIEISTIELERGGVSYTSDTIRQLKIQTDTSRIGLIMGDDHIDTLNRWHDFGYLKENVEYLICRRQSLQSEWNLPQDLCYRALVPEEPAPQSSSAIRSDLANNIDYLSPRVREYVRAHNLYS